MILPSVALALVSCTQYFFHSWIQSPLVLNRQFVTFFHENFMHTNVGLIPLILVQSKPKAALCSLNTFSSLSSSSLVSDEEIIIGDIEISSKNAYRKWLESCLNLDLLLSLLLLSYKPTVCLISSLCYEITPIGEDSRANI